MPHKHLIWDKLKSDTRSADIKLQRVQSNLVKGLVPIVSVIEKLVKARDKIPKDALDQGLGRPCAMRVWRIKLRNGPLKKYLPGL